MKYTVVFISCLLAITNFVFGQVRDKSLFSGIVLDSDSINNPIPCTNIFLKNGMGTKTDVNGEFSISVAKGDSLVFSHVGFHSLVIVISDLAPYNKEIYLFRDTIDIKEVTIYPLLNYEEFRDAFVNMPLDYNIETFNAKNNIELCLHQARSGVTVEWTAEDMAEYSLKRFSNSIIYAGQIYPENMINSSQLIMGFFSLFSQKKNNLDFFDSYQRKQNQFYYLKGKQKH